MMHDSIGYLLRFSVNLVSSWIIYGFWKKLGHQIDQLLRIQLLNVGIRSSYNKKPIVHYPKWDDVELR